MSIKDRLDNLNDDQKIYLCMILFSGREMDNFARNYPLKDEYFDLSDPYYSIGTDFHAYSYSKDEVLDLIFDSSRIANVDYIEDALRLVEEAI